MNNQKSGSLTLKDVNEPDSTNYNTNLDKVTAPGQQVVSLTCPSCGEVCSVDSFLFPVGATLAACSACEEQLVLSKGQDGSISVEKYTFEPPDQSVGSKVFGSEASGTTLDSVGTSFTTDVHIPSTKSAQEKPSKPLNPGKKTSVPSKPVVCPKCLGRYRVPLSKIPRQGAWVTCPSCSERFIIKLNDQSFTEPQTTTAPQTTTPHGAMAVPGATKEIKPHMYRLWNQEQVSELEVTILDPVTPMVRRYWGIGLVAALLLIFLAEALILRSSLRTANSMTELQQNSRPQAPQVYGLDELALDLRSLQIGTVNSTFVDREIDFTGHESRIYKYAVSQLAPGNCQSITRLNLQSNEPGRWLNLIGTCFNQSERPATIRVAWNGRYADLFVDGHARSTRLNVLIHPPEPSPGESEEVEVGE
jgi:predicted Zn finger-like uncharacterized protein